MPNRAEVRISSWNVRGLNKMVKLKQVLGRIKQLKSGIIFLQETHLAKKDIDRVRVRWPGQVFSACFTSQARGVMILIHKSIPFMLKDKYVDQSGRFLILNGTIFSTQINFVNVYAPNGDNPSFYQNVFLSLSTCPGYYIVGGDFNCVIDPIYDRSTSSAHQQTRRIIKEHMIDLNLTEIWRYLNPNKRDYSCHSNTHKTYSRIDYFLISKGLVSLVDNCWYDSILLSDHAPITLTLQISKLSFSPPLQDPKFGKI